jgi:4-hydroxythreonine-4-phosphate dehydrogenase
MSIKPIILIEGDPRGVFLELFLKSIKSKNFQSKLILICSKNNLIKTISKYNYKFKINLIKSINLDKIKSDNNKINIINIELETTKFKKENNRFIKNYIENCFSMSFKIIKSGLTNKFINGPIEKEIFLKRKFPGITEYISNKFNQKKTGMLIYNKKISVCPVTTHLPLKKVIYSINRNKIQEKISLVNDFYLKYLNLKPRIAVTGLNPHCESILKFNEDEKIIKPAIETMKKRNINVKGPFSADTIFSKKNRKLFDVVIGMYHDQVLAPFKALYEFDAVNITMGLPFLRATPDHGPNKEMAGKNMSNPKSLIRALEFLDKR